MVIERMRAAFGSAVFDLLDEDPRVALIAADISVSAHLHRSIARHPTRAINIGIAEQTMVGMAAGFAMEGFYPIAHSLSTFVAERPYEQLKLDIGYQGLGGTFVGVGGSYDYAAEGATHQAPADAGLMFAIPRMQVLVPGHEDEVVPLLRQVYAGTEPSYLRLGAARNPQAFDVAPGRLEVIARGVGPVVVVAFGPMLWPALRAVEGRDVTVLYATSLRPFDAGALAAATGDAPIVVAVEPWYQGTAAPVLNEALAHRPARFVSIGVPRDFIHRYGTREGIDRALGLDATGIRRRLAEVMD